MDGLRARLPIGCYILAGIGEVCADYGIRFEIVRRWSGITAGRKTRVEQVPSGEHGRSHCLHKMPLELSKVGRRAGSCHGLNFRPKPATAWPAGLLADASLDGRMNPAG